MKKTDKYLRITALLLFLLLFLSGCSKCASDNKNDEYETEKRYMISSLDQKDICEKQKNSNWGSKFIEQTAIELRIEFPEIKGFSRRNLYAMKQLYEFYSQKYSIVPQGVAQIPWGHNRLIISKVKDIVKAEFKKEGAML